MFQPLGISTSLVSVLRKRKGMISGGTVDDNHDPLGMGGDDPLLRMPIYEPPSINEILTLARRTAPIKRVKLSKAEWASSSSPVPVVKLKSSLLHQSCRLFPKCAAVIESALEMEPEAATQRAESFQKGVNSYYIVGDVRVPYSLPVNILLHQDASPDVVALVAKAAPEALTMKDGRDECCSLIIALRLYGRSTQTPQEEEEDQNSNILSTAATPTIPEAVLNANTTAAQIHDKRRNFPLHVAAYVGSSFAVMMKLYYAYPEALLETNFYGETPLDICIRNGKCSDVTTNFLQEKLDHLKTAQLRAMRRNS